MKVDRPKTHQHKKSVCVLLSGGLDSAACIAFYQGRGHPVHALHIDYGQSAAKQENAASEAIADHFRVRVHKLCLRGAHAKSSGLVQGRNAFLLLAALMEFSDRASFFATGMHAGTAYGDCTPTFVDSMQRVFDIYTDGVCRVAAPFVEWTKRDIWEFCVKREIPVNLTYSCEVGGRKPCGRCLSCKDLEVLCGA